MQPTATYLSSVRQAMQPAGASQVKAPKKSKPLRTSSQPQSKEKLFSKTYFLIPLIPHISIKSTFQFPPNTTIFFLNCSTLASNQSNPAFNSCEMWQHTIP
ncbi:hypothetical protein PHAVU_004G032100 [Phaseolus vulgaris]|uniref:Uncharacterized protein n=1 Tax=Phaseolus vulgaris TaxID=3885 RepID=V7C302_PHAVU|nr:hypothetical protein PHAVU_004G032100g [Phaseolus vulgaris]ESW23261.1 hypothetical protein PHAVU_004G032100g [Phaseolus vulgaris]